MVEGDGIAQRVQPIEGNNSTRVLTVQEEKRGAVRCSRRRRDEECWGQETQRRWACQEREPKTVAKDSHDPKIRSVLLHQVTCKTKKV